MSILYEDKNYRGRQNELIFAFAKEDPKAAVKLLLDQEFLNGKAGERLLKGIFAKDIKVFAQGIADNKDASKIVEAYKVTDILGILKAVVEASDEEAAYQIYQGLGDNKSNQILNLAIDEDEEFFARIVGVHPEELPVLLAKEEFKGKNEDILKKVWEVNVEAKLKLTPENIRKILQEEYSKDDPFSRIPNMSGFAGIAKISKISQRANTIFELIMEGELLTEAERNEMLLGMWEDYPDQFSVSISDNQYYLKDIMPLFK